MTADDYYQTILMAELEQLHSDLQRQLAVHEPVVERLLELDTCYGRIADFGCGNGSRTIALMLKLGATEVVGVDIDQEEIDLANQVEIHQKLERLREEARKIKEIRSVAGINLPLSAHVRARADYLVNRYENIPLPHFRQGDISKGPRGTGLPSDHFDVVYCRYVLYHLFCDNAEMALSRSRLAIEEMSRVAKPGGLVVAHEPYTCDPDDDTRVDLAPLFDEQVCLRFLDHITLPYSNIYIYARTDDLPSVSQLQDL